MFLARKSLSCSQIWQWVLPQGGIHMFHGNVWLLRKLQARIPVSKYHRSWFTPSEVWVRPGRATKLSSILQPHCADGETEAQQLHVLPAELTTGSRPLQSNPALWESPFILQKWWKRTGHCFWIKLRSIFQITQDIKVKWIVALLLSMFSANPNYIHQIFSLQFSGLSDSLWTHTHLDMLSNSPTHELLARSFALICHRWLYHDDAIKSVIS